MNKYSVPEKIIIGVISLLTGAYIVWDAIGIYSGAVLVSTTCIGTKKLFCEIGNMLYEQYGSPAIAIGHLAFGIIFLVIGYVFIVSLGENKSTNTLTKNIHNSEPEKPQTLEDVLHGQEPTEEFVALRNAKVSEDELERQALNAKNVESN